MLGYVKICKPELKIKDYEIYKGVYCSLCKELGKSFGPLARLTLSYDFTFLALLRMALNDTCTPFKKSHCSFNPLSKCYCCEKDNADIKFTSDIAMIIFYYKFKDNIDDNKGIKKLLIHTVYPFAKLISSGSRKRYTEIDLLIKNAMDTQKKIESDNCDSIDLAAEPTSSALSEIIALNAKDDDEKRVLKRLGYCLGRWIYIIDAVDDYDKDKKSKNYNPFLEDKELERFEDIKKYAEEALELTAAEAVKAYELLNIQRFDDILKNILFEGLYAETKKVLEGKEVHKREKSI